MPLSIIFLIANIISYSFIFIFIWKPKFIWLKMIESISINVNAVFFLILVAIGYNIASSPIWDLKKIVVFIYGKQNIISVSDFSGFNLNFIFRSIHTVLIGPILQELLFRKYLLINLLKKNSISIALIASSFCFSIIHFEIPGSLLPTFIFGIIVGFLYIKTGKIIYSILIHSINNLIATLLVIFPKPYYTWLNELNFNSEYWLLVLIGIFFVLYGLKKLTKTGIRQMIFGHNTNNIFYTITNYLIDYFKK